jgi:hypothetical protein
MIGTHTGLHPPGSKDRDRQDCVSRPHGPFVSGARFAPGISLFTSSRMLPWPQSHIGSNLARVYVLVSTASVPGLGMDLYLLQQLSARVLRVYIQRGKLTARGDAVLWLFDPQCHASMATSASCNIASAMHHRTRTSLKLLLSSERSTWSNDHPARKRFYAGELDQ